MAHPNEESRGVVPHLVVPSLIHSLHVFKVDELGFLAELLQGLRLAIAVIHGLLIIDRASILGFFAEEMFIPYGIVVLLKLFVGGQRPLLLLGDEQASALVCRERRHADFRATAVAVVETIRIAGFIESKVRS